MVWPDGGKVFWTVFSWRRFDPWHHRPNRHVRVDAPSVARTQDCRGRGKDLALTNVWNTYVPHWTIHLSSSTKRGGSVMVLSWYFKKQIKKGPYTRVFYKHYFYKHQASKSQKIKHLLRLTKVKLGHETVLLCKDLTEIRHNRLKCNQIYSTK